MIYLKLTSFFIFLSLLITSCIYPNIDDFVDEAKNSFNQTAIEMNNEMDQWDNLIDSIYRLSDSNIEESITLIDSLLIWNNEFDEFERWTLYMIKGEFYYSENSFELALYSFETSRQIDRYSDSPRSMINEAACHIILKDSDKAYSLIKKALDLNHDNYWYLGNYFEIIGDKEKAISKYNILLSSDSLAYKYCEERINQLNTGAVFYKRLKLLDFGRRKSNLIRMVPIN